MTQARRIHARRLIASGFLALGLSGCGAGALDPALTDLARNDPDRAIPALRAAILESPDDARYVRELGIAYYEKARLENAYYKTATYDSAVSVLTRARDMDPQDAETLFYSGATFESGREYSKAIDAYRHYTDAQGDDDIRDEMKARIAVLTSKQLKREVELAILAEQRIGASQVEPGTVAVTDFLSTGFAEGMDEIGRGMAFMITTDLSRIRQLRLLERQRIDVLLKELSLASPAGDDVAVPEARLWWPVSDIHGIKQRLRVLTRPTTGEPYWFTDLAESCRVPPLHRANTDPLPESCADVDEDSTLIKAVLVFQEDRGNLKIDGIVGPRTQAELVVAVQEMNQAQLARAIRDMAEQQGVLATESAQLDLRSPVDPATAPRLGMLLKAGTVVTGSVLGLSETQMQVDVLSVGVGSDREPLSVSGEGRLADFVEVEKEIVWQLIDGLGITLTDDEKEAIERQRPTESLPALLAFSTGLSLLSRDDFGGASAAFEQAFAMDDGFTAAKVAADEAALLGSPLAPPTAPRKAGVGLESRLDGTVDEVGGTHLGTDPTERLPRIPDFPAPPDRPPR